MLKKPDAGFLRSKTEGSGSAKKQRHSGPIAKNPGVFDRCPAGATPYRRFSARSLLFQVADAGCARALTLNAHIAFAFCQTAKIVKNPEKSEPDIKKPGFIVFFGEMGGGS